jgi:long-subunit acyl-CoA synthetase (AMP-forming)
MQSLAEPAGLDHIRRIDSAGTKAYELVTVRERGTTNPQKVTRLSSLFANYSELPVFDLSQNDERDITAFVYFSSGTSGKPKGVELTHYNLIASLAGIRSTDPSFYNFEIRGVFSLHSVIYMVRAFRASRLHGSPY